MALMGANGGKRIHQRQPFARFNHAAHHLIAVYVNVHHRRWPQCVQLAVEHSAQWVVLAQANHGLACQVVQSDVLLLGAKPAVRREQLYFSLGQLLAINARLLGRLQAQADVAFIH